jgi:hypothetical protein
MDGLLHACHAPSCGPYAHHGASTSKRDHVLTIVRVTHPRSIIIIIIISSSSSSSIQKPMLHTAGHCFSVLLTMLTAHCCK